jgi:hypothetical protein
MYKNIVFVIHLCPRVTCTTCTLYHVPRISYHMPRTPCPVPRTSHLVPRTLYLVPRTSYWVPLTQHPVPRMVGSAVYSLTLMVS